MEELLITENSVKEKLQNLKTDKSPGPDDNHSRFLKDYAEELSTPLTTLFKSSLDSMEVPADWRLAKITPLFKKGEKILAANYRPISLTCILCKILESFVRDHIISHMEVNGYFNERQFGFMTCRSTSLQMLKVLDMIGQKHLIKAIVLTVYT